MINEYPVGSKLNYWFWIFNVQYTASGDMSPVHHVWPKSSCRARKRREGRQQKRWEDNIKGWTGLELAKSQMSVEYRAKWGKLVVKSPVVLQRPSWLKNK